MHFRLGTKCGINLLQVARWTFTEAAVEPPPPAPPARQALPVSEEDRGGGTETVSTQPTSSPPPAPVQPVAQVPQTLPDCTLTLYFAGADPVPFANEEARAILGVLVAQSGSII